MRFPLFLLCLLAVPLCAAPVGWRMHDGRFPGAAPQASWSATERVVWATDLPQWSNGCPLLVGNRLFVTAEPATLLCLDLTGNILWQQTASYDSLMTADERARLAEERVVAAATEKTLRELRTARDAKRVQVTKAETDAKAAPDDAALQTAVTTVKAEADALETQFAAQRKIMDGYTLVARWRVPGTHPINGYTSNTPVSDGTRIFVTYGNGMVACYTLDGVCKWARLVEKPTHGWGQSGSPVLVGDTLVVQLIETFGLDAATGETRWHTKLGHVWGTPAVVRPGNTDLLLTDFGDLLNPADGKVLAKTGMALEYNSPLVVDNVAYCVSGKTARAFKLADVDGAVTATKLWETTVNNERYYASPLLDNGLLYLVNQRAGTTLTVLEAATGTLVYEKVLGLGGTPYPSPILAGNVIIIGSDNGKAAVITPGREYIEVSRPTLAPFRGTPLCAGPRMYIRTCTEKGSKLYCIGE